jgi:hypothetical protein
MGFKTLTKLMEGLQTGDNTGVVVQHYTTEWLLTYGVPVLLLILINTWLLPRYLHARYQLLVFLGAVILCWIILSSANALLYDLHLKYRLAHQTAKVPTAGQWQRGRSEGIIQAARLIVIYSLYLLMRETVMHWVKRQSNLMLTKACNQIVATAFLYCSGIVIMMVASSYDVFTSDQIPVIYVYIVPAVIITTFINLYVLFPWQYRKRMPVFKFACWLALVPAVVSLVPWVILLLQTGDARYKYLPLLWLIQVVVATPVSWWLFHLKKQQLTTLQLKKDLGRSTADLTFLRSQINPHFLFNTLNTLYGTALQENASRTAMGVQKLGDMMRFLLHENHREQIPLHGELEYLQNYIALQRLRIVESPQINIEITIENGMHNRLIAPMLLIPFVENAFKHGIRLTSPSFIRIHFYCDAKGIYLSVANSVHPQKNDESQPHESGIGLQNVQQRLQLIYPNGHTLQIRQQAATFEIHLHIALPEPQ